MLDLLQIARGKLNDPFIMDWALDRYEEAAEIDVPRAAAMAEAWFDEPTLRHWLGEPQDYARTKMFRVLPAGLFRGVAPTLLALWPQLKDTSARWAIPALLQNPAEDVVAAFSAYLAAGFAGDQTPIGIIRALTELPAPHGSQLLGSIAEHVLAMDDARDKMQLLRALLTPTNALAPDRLAALVAAIIATQETEEGDTLLLNDVSKAMFGDDDLLDYAEFVRDSDGETRLASLSRLFRDDAPLAELDRLLTGEDAWARVSLMLRQYEEAVPAAKHFRPFLDAILQMSYFDKNDAALLAVAALLAHFRREQLDTDSLSLEEALDLLGLQTNPEPYFNQILAMLKGLPREQVAATLIFRLADEPESWATDQLARLAGELRLVEAVPVLLDLIGEEAGDYVCEAARSALIRIGGAARQAVLAGWDHFDDTQQIYGSSVLRAVGGEEVIDFAVAHFSAWMHGDEASLDDMESWCMLAEAVPDARLRDLLGPELGRDQNVIDETFYRLCLLTGIEPEGLEDVRQRILEARRSFNERMTRLIDEDVPASVEHVSVGLRCRACGDTNRYVVHRVFAGRDADEKSTEFLVADEFPCLSCGEWTDFEMTRSADMAIMSYMLRHHVWQPREDNDEPRVVQYFNLAYRGDTRSITSVFAELKAAIAVYPQGIENHLRLGRVNLTLDRPRAAGRAFARALELDPNAMEAELGAAQALVAIGQQAEAFDRLGALLERKPRWRFYRTDEVTAKGLADEFLKAYRQLRKELHRLDAPLLLPANVEVGHKVGRNDPCPCGSGKKYKKCCLH